MQQFVLKRGNEEKLLHVDVMEAREITATRTNDSLTQGKTVVSSALI